MRKTEMDDLGLPAIDDALLNVTTWENAAAARAVRSGMAIGDPFAHALGCMDVDSLGRVDSNATLMWRKVNVEMEVDKKMELLRAQAAAESSSGPSSNDVVLASGPASNTSRRGGRRGPSNWEELCAWRVQQLDDVPLSVGATMRLKEDPGMPVRAVGEPVGVTVHMRNPLNVPLELKNVRLYGEMMPADDAADASVDTSEWLTVEGVESITIPPQSLQQVWALSVGVPLTLYPFAHWRRVHMRATRSDCWPCPCTRDCSASMAYAGAWAAR